MQQVTSAATTRPRAAEIAFGLALTVAACVVVFAAMLPFQVGSTVDRQRQAEAAKQVSSASLEQTLTVIAVTAVVIAVVYAALLVLFALRFRQGRRRARIGFIVLTVLALAPFNGQALLVCALLIVVDVLAFLRPVSEWLRSTELTRARAARR
jgi:chromate transport protein ChrA